MGDIDRIIAGMSEAQRAMLVRPNGVYQDSLSDIHELLSGEVLGTHLTPLGLAVRARLLQGEG